MTVKFDKEMLLKHRFLILVGVSTFLTMLGIVMVFSLISGRRALATVHCVTEPRRRRYS